jgi:hypothetical protein
VNVSVLAGDTEAMHFTELLCGALDMAGFTVKATQCMAIGNPKGLQIFDWVKTQESRASCEAIQKALAAMGYESTIKDSSGAISDGPINIHVGARR